MAYFRLLTDPVKASIVSGDLRAGNVFQPSGRTLVDETIPQVSEPPGNPAGFQAHAEFFRRVEKPP
jgi:hypothetical protein